MRRDVFRVLFLAVFLFIPFRLTAAGESTRVVINEVAWMGSASSANDEWIELYNNSDQAADLSGWRLAWGNNSIELQGQIAVNGYFLLERSDDESVSGITADQIYTGALPNGGVDIFLYDENDGLVDKIDAANGWPAGDNTTKQTMARSCPPSDGSLPTSWQSSAAAGGTPRAVNDNCQLAGDIQEFGGRLCYLENYRWVCSEGSLLIDRDNETIMLSDADTDWFRQVPYDIYRNFSHFSLYLGRSGGKVAVLVNKESGVVLARSRGVWFRGQAN